MKWAWYWKKPFRLDVCNWFGFNSTFNNVQETSMQNLQGQCKSRVKISWNCFPSLNWVGGGSTNLVRGCHLDHSKYKNWTQRNVQINVFMENCMNIQIVFTHTLTIECSDIFVQTNLTRMNVRKYLWQIYLNIRIFKNFVHTLDWSQFGKSRVLKLQVRECWLNATDQKSIRLPQKQNLDMGQWWKFAFSGLAIKSCQQNSRSCLQ